jgi:hypothetical protein
MSDSKPLVDSMVRNLILTWYDGTNEHRPVEELLAILSDEVEMLYLNQEHPFVGHAKFREWYADVLLKYFDETHEVEAWSISVDGARATARVTTRWEARSWIPGEAYSRYEAYLTFQVFEIERRVKDGRVVITKKFVERAERTAPIHGTTR